MSLKERIYKFFGWKFNPPQVRVRLQDVKPDDYVYMEWHRFASNKGYMKCINNDTKTKKILLGVKWKNYEEANCDPYEEIIFDYNHTAFKNFNLLNKHLLVNVQPKVGEQKDKYGEVNDIAYLQKLLNEALSNEEYEEADLIQKRIDKLIK